MCDFVWSITEQRSYIKQYKNNKKQIRYYFDAL